ncbi:RICIN domain-containing protein [Streptomyces sp. NBC_01304]|uniref:RICIN domain-containing protein n=1 Tax=Streptomyces sp. NBC_01304 TaxID=2903818 RepID=UPI002E11D4F4|nr:helix-turn-helix domain-containing protein [Streptomyces sp. NBC_01304]
MACVGNLEELSPDTAQTAADLVVLMQRLKERSGLTYRELEKRAGRSGSVLARSTLADTLRRTNLPRPDVLASFVRACGDETQVGSWLGARDRIAAALAADTGTRTDSRTGTGIEPRPPQAQIKRPTAWRPRWAKGPRIMLAALLTLPLLALGAWRLLPSGSHGTGTPAAATPADGWVTIRPARTPDLCLTDGRDRDGAYDSAVAVQLLCSQATVPRTYVEPVGEDLYRIQWHHPEHGKGCLTIMSDGPVRGMLEPRTDCAQATLFRLEPVAAGSKAFRLRPTTSTRCVGIAGNDTADGAEAVEERCTGAADQRFLIRAS